VPVNDTVLLQDLSALRMMFIARAQDGFSHMRATKSIQPSRTSDNALGRGHALVTPNKKPARPFLIAPVEEHQKTFVP